jgi:hypothetical protein
MANPPPPIVFEAEIKKAGSKKLVSLDVEYEALFRSADPSVMLLGSIPGDVLVRVTVEVIS